MSSKAMRKRFEAKTEWDGECLVWTAGRHGQGYGQFHTGREGDRKMSYAHRVAYEIYVGPIPKGLLVLHRCDNPPCVRPEHLFVGTEMDNIRDRDAKGRQNGPRGEAHHSAKLCVREVREIRELHAVEKCSVLAKKYGVSEAAISKVGLRLTWKSVK